jgi:aminopeptidase N
MTLTEQIAKITFSNWSLEHKQQASARLVRNDPGCADQIIPLLDELIYEQGQEALRLYHQAIGKG